LIEAFGRTVMEAIFSGVPCVLPHSFRDSFGDLAFYSDVENVSNVVKRLGENDVWRNNFVEYARQCALSKFDSQVLVKRLSALDSQISLRTDAFNTGSHNTGPGEDDAMQQYRAWVETGVWPSLRVVHND